MTHCDACPFAGCPACPAPGGDPQGTLVSAGGSGYGGASAGGLDSGSRETMDLTTKSAPGGASTPFSEGLAAARSD